MQNERTDIFPDGVITGVSGGSPPEQTARERLETAKHHYLVQTATMTPEQKQQRRVAEYLAEKVISVLPPPAQIEARTKFYEEQIRQAIQADEPVIRDNGFYFDR